MNRREKNPWRARRVLGVVACLVVAGCASVRDRPPDRFLVGNQGAGWEAVLPGAFVAMNDGTGPEAWRRDVALGVEPLTARTALDDWPEPDRPSLEDARRLYLRNRPDTVLYFQYRERRHWRHWR